MDKWILQEKATIPDSKKNSLNSYYYTRDLAGYSAHIFLIFFHEQDMLKNNWEWIEEYIAFHYQAKIDKDVEMSNFYICYFVDGNVDSFLQKTIEQGTYCAKKYVFSNKAIPAEEACRIVENKIFALDLKKKKKKPVDKIREISIVNFRKYNGVKTFPLRDNTGSAASFVLIYAPNGSGKTSFTDGVEFALKGEVTRLKELSDLTKAKGMIYHNFDRPDEQGYVELVLSGKTGEKIIRRTVGSVRKEKNDVWRCSPSKGKEILGDDPTKWNLLILPHDKVNSFLTATTPADRYREWFEHAPDLKEEREAFENIYEEYQTLL